MQGEIVEAAVGEAVTVVWAQSVSTQERVSVMKERGTFGIFHPRDEICFCESGYAFMNSTTTSKTG